MSKLCIYNDCALCQNERTSFENGLTCNLTQKKPNFINTCSKIKFDEKFLEKLERTNLELVILSNNKNSIHLTIFWTSISGILLIIGGYYFSEWTILSVFIWSVKLGIIGMGFTFLGMAYSKLRAFKKQETKAKFEKLKIDEILKKYKIDYHPTFIFENKTHGIQEVKVNLEFKNWLKNRTTTAYKINV